MLKKNVFEIYKNENVLGFSSFVQITLNEQKAELFLFNYNISCHLSVKFEDCVCIPNNLYF